MDTLLKHTLDRISHALESRAAEHDLTAANFDRVGRVGYRDWYQSKSEECREIAKALRTDTLAGCELEGGGC